MSDFCRTLITDIQIEQFVENILEIYNETEKRAAINLIANAERNMSTYFNHSTLHQEDYRDFSYRNEKIRLALRNEIINELFTLKRLNSDDDIALGQGGAAPRTHVMKEGKVFYLIGPPASGKSSIAAKIADTFGCYILDSDFAKRKFPEYKNQISAASLLHEESNALIFGENGLMDLCIREKSNIVIPKIGNKESSIKKLCTGFKEAGYSIYLISVDLDRQIATQRAFYRFKKTKRYVPLALIFDGYGNDPTLNYFKLKRSLHNIISGFCQISTNVAIGESYILEEEENFNMIYKIFGR